jgi:hypothetical protein
MSGFEEAENVLLALKTESVAQNMSSMTYALISFKGLIFHDPQWEDERLPMDLLPSGHTGVV